MGWRRLAAAALALSAVATPVAAQMGYEGDSFVKAVREQDNGKAVELLRARGEAIVNARDAKGDTALIVAIQRRDDTWTGYLLREGANPNLPNRSGETPLLAASRIGYMQGIEWLIAMGARVDGTNRMGETPLIVAVQARHLPAVRMLLDKGANPDKTDAAAGYSARDYARRDNRGGDLLRIIETKKPKPVAGTAAR